VLEPKGGSRPAWKILRVLGNLTGVDGFDYISSEDVRNEVRSLCESIELSNAISESTSLEINAATNELHRSTDIPMYATDALVRRASSLQKTNDAQSLCVRLNTSEAGRLNVSDANTVTVKQSDVSSVLSLVIDDTIPDASVWIPIAVEGCDALGDALGDAFGVVSIEKASQEGKLGHE
jgi:NADH-quinone oxidoreductase subunit G